MRPSKEEIRETVIQIATEMLKEWGVTSLPVEGPMRFSADLGWSSVDALQLAATLDMRLKTKLPYQKLMGPDGQYPTDITVDQLAAFAFEHFDETPEGPVAA